MIRTKGSIIGHRKICLILFLLSQTIININAFCSKSFGIKQTHYKSDYDLHSVFTGALPVKDSNEDQDIVVSKYTPYDPSVIENDETIKIEEPQGPEVKPKKPFFSLEPPSSNPLNKKISKAMLSFMIILIAGYIGRQIYYNGTQKQNDSEPQISGNMERDLAVGRLLFYLKSYAIDIMNNHNTPTILKEMAGDHHRGLMSYIDNAERYSSLYSTAENKQKEFYLHLLKESLRLYPIMENVTSIYATVHAHAMHWDESAYLTKEYQNGIAEAIPEYRKAIRSSIDQLNEALQEIKELNQTFKRELNEFEVPLIHAFQINDNTKQNINLALSKVPDPAPLLYALDKASNIILEVYGYVAHDPHYATLYSILYELTQYKLVTVQFKSTMEMALNAERELLRDVKFRMDDSQME